MGGTQCDGGKCKDAAKRSLNIRDYLATDGQLVYEATGVVELGKAGLYDVRATIEATTGESRGVTAIPIRGESLDDLRGSKSKVDRMLADAIASHVQGQHTR